MNTNDIVMFSATELRAAIAARSISCAEVMSSTLDHISRVNPKVNAIVALGERDTLMVQARGRDEAVARGHKLGKLHGLPFAVKDLQPVRGLAMTQGSPLLKDFVAPADGWMVERLRREGAIFIGKTNTPEFGLGSHTVNPVHGATANAYDQRRSAGGSSGGAAVTLALRMLPLADGSDYGGSLRNPAGWNNVLGFRPSIGRIATESPDLWLPSMGVLGPMARNVRDLALLLSVQAGYDPRAPLSLDGDGSAFAAVRERDFKGTRIAFSGDFGGLVPYEPEVLAICRKALAHFEALGCIVEEAVPDHPIENVWQAFLTLRAWHAGAGLNIFYEDSAKRILLNAQALHEIEAGRKLSAFAVSEASVARTTWSKSVARFLSRFDYWLVPTAQVLPFPITERWPEVIAGQRMATYHEWMKAVCLVTMSGCPALAVPAGFSANGLPMGLQIVAPARAETSCLELALAYEGVNPFPLVVPPLLAN
jgi:amidase